MKAATRLDHRDLAEALRRRVLEGPGVTGRSPRQAVAASSAGGPPAPHPYDGIARQVGEAACRTTDAQVESVIKATGSQKAACELIVAAAVGAGLLRWQQAIKAIDEATDAPE